MIPSCLKKPLLLIAAFAALWLGIKYLLPVALPFLLGLGLALAAEPLVRRVSTRLPRAVAAGLGVSVTLVGIVLTVSLAGAAAVRELAELAADMPDLEDTARQGMMLVQDWLVSLSEQAPEGIRPVLQRTVLSFFDDGTVFLEQAAQNIPSVVGAAIGQVGSGAMGLGTGVVAAFLLSARLPKLKETVDRRLPASWHEKYLPALRRVRRALGGWLKAQLKLCAVTWGIVSVGFLLLRIPYGIAWAALVAVVDAVPILGTGTVLLPWALVCLLQGESLRAIGLLCTYGAAMITRTVLEPKLVGRHLGLDPLVTLAALYTGYRFWGFLGLLLTPILASAAKSLFPEKGVNN